MAVSRDEVEVLALNRAFYAAFRARDLSSMDDLWAREHTVTCIHPGWLPLRGRQQVMASWRAIFGDEDGGGDGDSGSNARVRCASATAQVVGDTAIVLCDELFDEAEDDGEPTEDEEDGHLVATNIFTREDGEWRLLHHQAGPVAPSARVNSADLDEVLSGGIRLGDTDDDDDDDDDDDLDDTDAVLAAQLGDADDTDDDDDDHDDAQGDGVAAAKNRDRDRDTDQDPGAIAGANLRAIHGALNETDAGKGASWSRRRPGPRRLVN